MKKFLIVALFPFLFACGEDSPVEPEPDPYVWQASDFYGAYQLTEMNGSPDGHFAYYYPNPFGSYYLVDSLEFTYSHVTYGTVRERVRFNMIYWEEDSLIIGWPNKQYVFDAKHHINNPKSIVLTGRNGEEYRFESVELPIDTVQYFQQEWREGYWTYESFAIDGVHEGYHFYDNFGDYENMDQDRFKFEHFAVYPDSLSIDAGYTSNWDTPYFEFDYEMIISSNSSLFCEYWGVDPSRSDSLNIYAGISTIESCGGRAYSGHGGDYHLVRITKREYDSLKALGE